MKRSSFVKISSVIVLSFLLFSFLCCSKDGLPASKIPPVKQDTATASKPVYALVWSDEFDGAAVDPGKWTYDLGNLNVNSEKEFYQTENATVSNGNLVITAKKEIVGGQPYTSSRLKTQGKFAATYGRIEANIKLPMGMGMWPAFWMLGANVYSVSWPQCGELDIMEHINNTSSIYGTMHWNNNGHAQYGRATSTTPGDYHLYAIEWDANQIRWYVDNTLYQTGNIKNDINNTAAFHLPFFILLNLAVAGDFPGQLIDETLLPESMYVDYVRVYKQTN